MTDPVQVVGYFISAVGGLWLLRQILAPAADTEHARRLAEFVVAVGLLISIFRGIFHEDARTVGAKKVVDVLDALSPGPESRPTLEQVCVALLAELSQTTSAALKSNANPEPSARAKGLADTIHEDASPFALA